MCMIKQIQRILYFGVLVLLIASCSGVSKNAVESSLGNVFPDGTPISEWFLDTVKVDPTSLGEWYSITEAGAVADDKTINTQVIQALIDEVSSIGGGVIVVPEGTFKTGALFFKPGTHLHIKKGGVLKGSDDIADYPKMPSRMEGQNLDYYPALINAYKVDDFTITGEGTIDGNGAKFWDAFWARRKENPKCTNLEVSRPRLVFLWDCDHAVVQDVHLERSGFWTTHLYQCNWAKLIDLHIYAPFEPVRAPSSDAIDLDVCSNVVVRGCYMSVCDDAVVMKGGKGPFADEDSNNGKNEFILIENNNFGKCHSTFTIGSESIHTKNVLVRNNHMTEATRMVYLKMRPDTPQIYEYITIEGYTGTASIGVFINPWTQFYDLKGRKDPPSSISRNITFKNITGEFNQFTKVSKRDDDILQNFAFEGINVTAKGAKLDSTLFNGLTIKNSKVNGEIWNGK